MIKQVFVTMAQIVPSIVRHPTQALFMLLTNIEYLIVSNYLPYRYPFASSHFIIATDDVLALYQTSLPVDSSAAPSVEDLQDRLPSICVDYLSHDWSEEDVWASWRNMTRHKHEIANGVRLENASWRTWQKQRNNLKTINPETLNW